MTPPLPADDSPLEFTFGPLSTASGRARRSRSRSLGLQHFNSIEPLDPLPGQDVSITIQAGVGVALKSASLLYTVDGSTPQASSSSSTTVSFSKAGSAWDTLSWSHLETWKTSIPGQTEGTLVRYRITAISTDGKQIPCPFFNSDGLSSPGAEEELDLRYLHRLTRDPKSPVFGYRVDTIQIPDWVREAVIYQVFVDRFAADPGSSLNENDDLTRVSGGTLRGITSRLGYLQALGVNCLWLTPVSPAPSYHGYDPTDHTAVEPRLGKMEDLQELIHSANKKGIRVLLDFVANHVSNLHPAFLSARGSPGSPTRDWFFFRGDPEGYESFYDVPGQPILNTDTPAVRQYLIEAAEGWLKLGCDGFRLDHAHGASHAFWSEFRNRSRAANADSVMIGEITEEPSAVVTFTGRMDGALDFTLLDLFRKFFAFRVIKASEFEKELRLHLEFFGQNLVLPSFLDNHDMNRFLWVVGGDTRRLTLAALCQFTLPQPPVIYYGTEVGLTQRRAVGALEESRLPMLWDERQDVSLLKYYTDLIHLRRSMPGNWKSIRVVERIDDDGGTLVYQVGSVLVFLNNSPEGSRVELPCGKVLLANQSGVAVNRGGIDLPPFSGAICEALPQDDHPGGGQIHPHASSSIRLRGHLDRLSLGRVP